MEKELDETKEELSVKTSALLSAETRLEKAEKHAEIAERERSESKEEQGKMRHRLELAQSHACETIEDYKVRRLLSPLLPGLVCPDLSFPVLPRSDPKLPLT